jgi:hypothetical protein
MFVGVMSGVKQKS